MPIRPFLKDIAKMSAAFEGALRKLGLVDRNGATATAAAKLIIEFAKAGQRDPRTPSRPECGGVFLWVAHC